MEKFEIMEWDMEPFLVYHPGDNVEQIRRILESGEVKGLRIISDNVPFELDFLRTFDFVKCLHIGDLCKSYDYKFDFLSFLPNLEELIINLYCNSQLDISSSPPIKKLYLQWRKKMVIGLDKCANLRDICVSAYKEPDFEQFRPLKILKRIIIKTGSMKNLDGLEGCRSLEILSLAGCRYLTDISKLSELPSLKSLHLDSCSQVHDFSVLSKLPNLERLWIEDTRNIESISFLRDMPQLKEFCVIGNCSITDGDLSPALNTLAQITPQKHYNMEILPPDWRQKGGSTHGWWYSDPIDLGD